MVFGGRSVRRWRLSPDDWLDGDARRSGVLRSLAIGMVAALLVACGGADPVPSSVDGAAQPEPAADDGDGPLIVATTSILGDVVSNIIGDDGEVVVLMPPGADPHTYQPSAADGAVLRDADLVVANGLNLEENLTAVLAAAAEEGVRIFGLAEHLDPIEFGSDHHDHGHEDHGHEDHGHEEHGHEEHGHEDHGHEDHGHGHDHGPEDPHVWFDPIRMADGVRLIAAEIAAVDARLDEAEWLERVDTYATEILEVHEEIAAQFEQIPSDRRVIVTNHDALGYLAYRYDLEVVGTIIPGSSTQAEADPRSFAALADLVGQRQVPAIFAENTDSTRLAEQLASEVVGRADLEVQVVAIYTDALGEPGSGAETYLGLLRTTANLISEALTG